MIIKLIDNTNRQNLSEGRSMQMGFGFAKRIDDDTYEMVTPISPCKDYLNDVIWSEAVDKPIYAYGLSYTKQNIYDKEYAYLVMSILTHKNGIEYTGYQEDVKRLEENYKSLEIFINYFEKTLTKDIFTKIEKIENNKYLVKVPLFFVQGTYLISLYSLLLRAGQYWNGEQNPQEFFDTFQANLTDVSLVRASSPKLKKLLENGYVGQNLHELRPGTSVHNTGIVSFQGL